MEDACSPQQIRRSAWEFCFQVLRPLLREHGAGTPRIYVAAARDQPEGQEGQDVVLVLQGMPTRLVSALKQTMPTTLGPDRSTSALRFSWDEELDCDLIVEPHTGGEQQVAITAPRREPDLFD